MLIKKIPLIDLDTQTKEEVSEILNDFVNNVSESLIQGIGRPRIPDETDFPSNDEALVEKSDFLDGSHVSFKATGNGDFQIAHELGRTASGAIITYKEDAAANIGFSSFTEGEIKVTVAGSGGAFNLRLLIF